MKKSLERIAEELATRAHAGQVRKDGKTPYITHPEAVVSLLKNIGIEDENIIAAGWLHDTIEDCGITRQVIEREVNSEVARIVSILTRDVGREEYIERIRKANYSVKIVKLADFVHNCSTLSSELPAKTIQRKVEDAKKFYLALAQEVHPPWGGLINGYISPEVHA